MYLATRADGDVIIRCCSRFNGSKFSLQKLGYQNYRYHLAHACNISQGKYILEDDDNCPPAIAFDIMHMDRYYILLVVDLLLYAWGNCTSWHKKIKLIGSDKLQWKLVNKIRKLNKCYLTVVFCLKITLSRLLLLAQL